MTAAAPEYGSDTSGLEWFNDPSKPAGFVWLHFSLSNTRTEPWIRKSLPLAELFYESLHQSVGSTRLEVDDETLVAVVHDVMFNSNFDSGNISTLTLCLESRPVVSARLRPLRSVDMLPRNQAAVLAEIVRESTLRVDTIEDSLPANRISTSRGELSSLRRSLVRLPRLLAPEPAALFRSLSIPRASFSSCADGRHERARLLLPAAPARLKLTYSQAMRIA